MQINQPLALLGGLTPQQFMRRYWGKQPLLVRQALPDFTGPISRQTLFGLATREDVESKIVEKLPQTGPSGRKVGTGKKTSPKGEGVWRVRQGPFKRHAFPPIARPEWTLLLQGVEAHHPDAYALMQRFRFIPDARLDDVLIAWASDNGGVGPHYDAYDVFLVQGQGRGRWRIGPVRNMLDLRDDVPLRILKNFEPQEDLFLEPGDLLYLPPLWGHDGTGAGGECVTYSVGFRTPRRTELAREVAFRALEDLPDDDVYYTDPIQAATPKSAAIPLRMQQYAHKAIAKALASEARLNRALGEYLSEPKPGVWFEGRVSDEPLEAVRLASATRMLYDGKHCYINGESYRMSGADAALMRNLANARRLTTAQIRRASAQARELLLQWRDDGWVNDDE